MSLIPPIVINMSSLIEEFHLVTSEANNLSVLLVNNVTDMIFYNWKIEASQNLHSTRNRYIDSLQIGTNSPTSKYIILTDKLANMIESGASSWDIKEGFAKSSKRKIVKSGPNKGKWYMTVPFRHATPGSLGENSAFSGVMPQEVYNAVLKGGSGSRTMPNIGRVENAVALKNVPAPYNIPKSRSGFSDILTKTTYEEYTHKSSIYSGMVREKETYESATQGQYVTFRRVSENSDPNSWIHRGFIASNFAQKAIDKTHIGEIVDRGIDNFLVSRGF